VSRGYCDGGDGGGFGAEDARAEGDVSPFVLGEEGDLFGGPAAFGADGDGVGDGMRHVRKSGGGASGLIDCLITCGSFRVFEGLGEGGGLFGFTEQDAGGGLFLLEGLLESDGIGDLGDIGAAGLLRGFESDAAPALGSLGGGLGEMFFGATGEDRRDAGDTELGGLFDGPLHVVELEDGEEEMERKGGVGGEFFVEKEVNCLFADLRDFGAVEESAGDDVVDLTWFSAEDAGEMGGLVAGEGGGGGGPGVGDEAATGHAFEFSL
jgi:hypothetical protein